MEKQILAVFTIACQEALLDKDFDSKRSEIKKLFYQRNFDGIFKNPELLATYTADYAPSRALCYAHLFQNESNLKKLLSQSTFESIVENNMCKKANHLEKEKVISIYCIGGGAGSEMIGIASVIAPMLKIMKSDGRYSITLQDIGDYRIVLKPLESALNRVFQLENPKSSIDGQSSPLSSTFPLIQFQHSVFDINNLQHEDWKNKIPSSQLITACFILNEILSASKSQFVKLITKLIQSMNSGSLLLVVDSAGSFSEVEVGSQTIMCFHLLDHIQVFECISRKDSEWYRIPQGLQYRSKLNNMRYFLRLYRKK